MRNDAAAKERRRQAAKARQAAPTPPPKAPRLPVPGNTDEALALARELGWSYVRTTDGYRLTHPSGATAMLHLTPSTKRGWRNFRADLLRPLRNEKAS